MFDPNNRVKIDPENNRRSMMPIVLVVIVMILALCLGVYFGFFAAQVLGG